MRNHRMFRSASDTLLSEMPDLPNLAATANDGASAIDSSARYDWCVGASGAILDKMPGGMVARANNAAGGNSSRYEGASRRTKKTGSTIAAITTFLIFTWAIRSCIPEEVTTWHRDSTAAARVDVDGPWPTGDERRAEDYPDPDNDHGDTPVSAPNYQRPSSLNLSYQQRKLRRKNKTARIERRVVNAANELAREGERWMATQTERVEAEP